MSAVIVLMTAPTLYVVARRAEDARRAAIADACAAEIARLPDDRQSRERTARALEQKYGLAALLIDQSGPISGRWSERRTIGTGSIDIHFRIPATEEPRRLLQIAAAAAALAVLGGMILLAQNLRALLRAQAPSGPSPHDVPQGETGYLFRTFETSIRDLKSRESEMQRLRDQEKERADELAAVTRTLVRSLTSGFISIDRDGLILDINEQGRELLGLPGRAVQGRPVTLALGESRFAAALQQAVEQRATFQRKEVEDSNGRAFGLTTVPLLDERGRYFGMLVLFVDLSPVRRLEERVRAMQSLADLGEMSAGIAHEFRNSLSTIAGYLRLARKDSLPREIDDRLARAENEAGLLNRAVESLLSFARPVSLQLERVDALEVLRSLVEQTLAGGEIAVEISGTPAPIEADHALLRRAFENILRNACDAIRSRDGTIGRIAISCAISDGWAEISVADNGIGFDPADAQRFFLPFQSTKPSGFGLGLALTKKIVLLHGGTIALEGAKGRGATVTVRLPSVS
jgi:signal transduction histidine kinase